LLRRQRFSGLAPGICVRALGGSIDGTAEAPGKTHPLAAAWRRQIEGLESLQHLSREGAAHIGIDEFVLHSPQSPRNLVVGDAQLVETLRILIGKEPEQIAYELLVASWFM